MGLYLNISERMVRMNSFIPVKTAKALLAISRRIHDLPPKLRTLLILIDGKTDIASLKKDISLLGDVAAMLSDLHKSGFIEFAENRTAAALLTTAAQDQYIEFLQTLKESESAALSPVAKGGAQRPTTGVDPSRLEPDNDPRGYFTQQVAGSSQTQTVVDTRLEQAKGELKAFLQSLMGDDYSLVAEKISGCDSAARFSALLRGFEDIIQNYGSRKSAEKFKSQFKEFY